MAGRNNIVLEGMDITFRNFAGAARQFNNEGDRNFCVLLPEDKAEKLAEDGLNIKRLRPRGDDELGQAYLKVKVSFKIRPPKLVMISSRGKTILNEDMAEIMDWVDVEYADIIINPSSWNMSGRSGKTAYLDSIYLVVHEDELMIKYRDVPEIDAAPKRPELESGPKSLPAGEDPGIWDGEVVSDSDDEQIPY